MLVDYDPEKHRGLPLFEVQTRKKGDDILSVMVRSDVSHDVAAKTPWYYMVEVSKAEKGGPGSGHHGHQGRPGHRGGSAPGKGKMPNPVSSNEAVQVLKIQAVRDAEEKCLRTPGKEEAIIVGSTGNVLFEVAGTDNAVYFQEYQIPQLKDATLVHDHPGGRCLSPEDIYLGALRDMEAVIAVSRTPADVTTGTFRRFTIRRPTNGWPPITSEQFYRMDRAIERELQDHYWPLVNSGEISPLRASYEHSVQEAGRLAAYLGTTVVIDEEPIQ